MRNFSIFMILLALFITPSKIHASDCESKNKSQPIDYGSMAVKFIKYNWQPYKPYPGSMRFTNIKAPRKMDFDFYPTQWLVNKQVLSGMGVCVDVNIKDRLTHQYIGIRKHVIYFVNGEIKGHDNQTFWQGPDQWLKASQECL